MTRTGTVDQAVDKPVQNLGPERAAARIKGGLTRGATIRKQKKSAKSRNGATIRTGY
jgi:hypothetical protein